MSTASIDSDRTIIHEGDLFSLGEILVAEKLITSKQLAEALALQKKRDPHQLLGQILLEQKLISKKQLYHTLDTYQKWPLLGELLIKANLIDNAILNKALQYQKEKECRLGEALVQLNLVSEKDLKQCLSSQLNIPFIDLRHLPLDTGFADIIPYQYAKKNMLVPIEKNGKTLTLAVDDPTNRLVLREIKGFTGYEVNVVTAIRTELKIALDKIFGENPECSADLELGFDENNDTTTKYIDESLTDEILQRRGNLIVERIIRLAIYRGATDIHVEAQEKEPALRFRIDGIMQEIEPDSIGDEFAKYYKEVISRLKILGRMDISEKRRPQDGSFRVQGRRVGGISKIDFRLSIVPAYFGENAVMRILDPRNAPKSFEALSFSDNITSRFNDLLQNKTGIILITGATGSGKSTSLYGALMSLQKPGVKILTAEDPIEYVYSGLTQCQVNSKIDNTFAAYIRTFLRQDPDIIMVGEIRDPETAEMTFRAAQTGHLVVSTLHTNNAIDSISRLLSLNVEPYQIISSLLGVLSQRLVRRICPNCKEPDTPSPELMGILFEDPPNNIKWYKGRGCSACNYTGYKGRMAVGELWSVSAGDRLNMSKDISPETIKQFAKENIITMMDDIYDKLIKEQTTLEEIFRAVPIQNLSKYKNAKPKINFDFTSKHLVRATG
ncbi:MAG: Flp pilus assembly complex ATPase component TadA [Deltaproteobacteria bacterium]|nr:Flp pilus assembly complex ATPase component TadA [Deltaproteobacteria bacterium]